MVNNSHNRVGDRIVVTALWVLPTRLISRAAGALARCRVPWVRAALIGFWCRAFPALDLSEAAEPDRRRYASFESFFTRELAAGLRPMPVEPGAIAMPVDGTLGAFGRIDDGTLMQAKGQAYSVNDLLPGLPEATRFQNGAYATFYLAPADYHRVHMPLAGRLIAARYIPGRLFGVNPRCVRTIPRLFTRNERLSLVFDTEAGAVAMIWVGAFIVGGIHSRWHGRICPPHRRVPRFPTPGQSNDAAPHVERGDYAGHFSIGSSVILLAQNEAFQFADDLGAGQPIRVGSTLGRVAP